VSFTFLKEKDEGRRMKEEDFFAFTPHPSSLSKNGDEPMPAEFTSTTYSKYLSEHKLMGTRCRADGRVFLPPRALCSESHDDMEWVELSGQGKLAGFTIIYVAPSAMLAAGYDRKNPYCVGVVRLAEGPAISAQILGVDV
jgi:uncharacterized OB-fold protein